MMLSNFYEALGISRYSSLDDIYNAYMREMTQFAPKAKRGTSFVMYPGELRNEIWYYNVAYLSLWFGRDMLREKSEKKRYQTLLNEHRKTKPGWLERFFIPLISYIIALCTIKGLIWLWKSLCQLWKHFF